MSPTVPEAVRCKTLRPPFAFQNFHLENVTTRGLGERICTTEREEQGRLKALWK